jgi:hypothetical protein
VAVLWGSHLPLILREAGLQPEREIAAADALDPGQDRRPTYRFVGSQIYVHGLMDGVPHESRSSI